MSCRFRCDVWREPATGEPQCVRCGTYPDYSREPWFVRFIQAVWLYQRVIALVLGGLALYAFFGFFLHFFGNVDAGIINHYKTHGSLN